MRDQECAARPLAVLLSGGIGNLLFQYAAGVQVAVEHRKRLVFAERTSGAVARLERFLERGLPVCGKLQGFILVGSQAKRSSSVYRHLGSKLAAIEVKRGALLSEWNPHVPYPSGIPERVWGLRGWFQHPSWSTSAMDHVCRDLLQLGWFAARPSQPFMTLNLRRGDFVQLGWALDEAYYDLALQAISDTRLPLVITCDDSLATTAVASYFRHRGFDIATPADVGAPTSAEHSQRDFWALAHASGVVMANSTFTWWATAVGDHLFHSKTERRVVYPRGWNGRPNADVLQLPRWTPITGSLQRYG